MASFHQQMQELADKIARSRHERRQTIERLPRQAEQLRRDVKRSRELNRRQLEQSAQGVARQLQSFTKQNRRQVERMLGETRRNRLTSGQRMRSQLQREVVRNRHDVSQLLLQHSRQRQRCQSHLVRQCRQSLLGIEQRVLNLRSATRRSLKRLGDDRRQAQRVWNQLRVNGLGRIDLRPSGCVPSSRPVRTAAN